ncbi:MAG: hypothetical protein CM15mV17_1350 [Caudoviricetes sp.]|nr:MAG: hypothetical protein CM15mV17_1350 [Caudoviricetes sp.]
MAILGKIDAATFSNNVAVTNGDATVTKNAADTVVVGDVLELGNVAYIVKQVNSTTSIELHKAYAGSTNSGLSGAVRRTPPKAVAEYVVKGGDSITDYQLIFVDTTEDGIASNKSRGIDGPGWWLYRTYNTAGGTTRHKAEKLAALRVAAGTSGDDADDTVAADVLETITIGTQPANQNTSSGAATFTVAATVDQSGTITYQWQKRTSSGGRFSNVSGATSASLALTGQTAANTGNQYRVKVNSSKGAAEVVSSIATLTFVS